MNESWTNLNASQLMEPTFFVPEKMSTWDALQEMRKRRVHMAIVVDEYGGTSGLVSFEVIFF
jgi:putative hemolysin